MGFVIYIFSEIFAEIGTTELFWASVHFIGTLLDIQWIIDLNDPNNKDWDEWREIVNNKIIDFIHYLENQGYLDWETNIQEKIREFWKRV